MLKAITLDYWDTLYDGRNVAERMALRREAMRRLVEASGSVVADEELEQVYRDAGIETERWWREEYRGYTTEERIFWMLDRLGMARPVDYEHVRAAVQAMDDALLHHPPPLLEGAARAVRALASRFRLGIISDTGFASGRAQDRLLEGDGLLGHFVARVYSCDVGRAKPHPVPFEAAAAALGVAPHEILHVGDIERTDVAGALGAGFRAVRADFVRSGGPSDAELVADDWDQLLEWVMRD